MSSGSSSSLSTISPASTTSVDLDISTREALRKTRQKFIDAMQKAADAVALLPIPADMNGWERLQIQEKNADLMAGAREPHIRQLAAWEESLAPAERDLLRPSQKEAEKWQPRVDELLCKHDP